MKFRHLVSFTHICYLTVDYDVYPMSRAHFSHFRTLNDFDLNEAIVVYDSIDVYDFII